MFNAPEQLVNLNKANLEAAVSIASASLEGAEKLLNLQLSAAREALAESAKTAKAVLEVKDAKELAALQPGVEPVVEKALDYSRSVYEAATQTQAEIAKVVEARVAELNSNFVAALEKALQSAPAGSEAAVAAVKSAVAAANSAYENIQKAAKKVTEITEANVAAATETVKAGAKKKAA